MTEYLEKCWFPQFDEDNVGKRPPRSYANSFPRSEHENLSVRGRISSHAQSVGTRYEDDLEWELPPHAFIHPAFTVIADEPANAPLPLDKAADA